MRAFKSAAVVTMMLFALISSTAAQAQYPPNGDEVAGTRFDQPALPKADANDPSEAIQPGGLAVTGADMTLFVAIALGAIAAGSLIVRRTRRPRAAGGVPRT